MLFTELVLLGKIVTIEQSPERVALGKCDSNEVFSAPVSLGKTNDALAAAVSVGKTIVVTVPVGKTNALAVWAVAVPVGRTIEVFAVAGLVERQMK